MGRKNSIKADGNLQHAAERLKVLLDAENPQVEAIVPKWIALNNMAKKATIERLLGETHWKKLQEVFETIAEKHPDLRVLIGKGALKPQEDQEHKHN